MENYQTDDQQVEDLKKWWAKNGKSTMIMLVLGLGAVLGGRGWVDYRDNQRAAAAAMYQSMIVSMQSKQLDAALEQGQRILSQYADTPYATLAALASAKIKHDKNDVAAARTDLQWVIDHGVPEQMVYIARLRMAKLQLDAGETQQALATLGTTAPDGFKTEFKELEGDIQLALNQPENARNAYKDALLAASARFGDKTLLEMKLENLGGEVPAPLAAQ